MATAPLSSPSPPALLGPGPLPSNAPKADGGPSAFDRALDAAQAPDTHPGRDDTRDAIADDAETDDAQAGASPRRRARTFVDPLAVAEWWLIGRDVASSEGTDEDAAEETASSTAARDGADDEVPGDTRPTPHADGSRWWEIPADALVTLAPAVPATPPVPEAQAADTSNTPVPTDSGQVGTATTPIGAAKAPPLAPGLGAAATETSREQRTFVPLGPEAQASQPAPGSGTGSVDDRQEGPEAGARPGQPDTPRKAGAPAMAAKLTPAQASSTVTVAIPGVGPVAASSDVSGAEETGSEAPAVGVRGGDGATEPTRRLESAQSGSAFPQNSANQDTGEANAQDGGGRGQSSWRQRSVGDAIAQFIKASGANATRGGGQAPVQWSVSATSTPAGAVVPTQTLEARSAAGSLPDADSAMRLVQTFRVLMRDGVSEATVQLKPEHLGAVSITIRVDRGTVSAVVHAESNSVRQWLERQEDAIRSALSEQGLHLERLVIDPDGDRRQPAHDGDEPSSQGQRQSRTRPQNASGDSAPTFDVAA